MHDDELLKFYEKLYFHELDAREKLVARMQLNLAVLTALATVLGYILARLELYAADPAATATFIVSYAVAVVCLSVAAYYFTRALWGHSYECLPVATEIAAYRNLLKSTYSSCEDGEELEARYFREFLSKYMCECASTNAKINEARYDALHHTMSFVVYAIGPTLVSVLVFLIGGLAGPAGS